MATATIQGRLRVGFGVHHTEQDHGILSLEDRSLGNAE